MELILNDGTKVVCYEGCAFKSGPQFTTSAEAADEHIARHRAMCVDCEFAIPVDES